MPLVTDEDTTDKIRKGKRVGDAIEDVRDLKNMTTMRFCVRINAPYMLGRRRVCFDDLF